jgi:20S proteasome subunit beta 3
MKGLNVRTSKIQPCFRFFRWIDCTMLYFCFLLFASPISAQQDPTTLNGGSVLAMAGKDCVAVAVDKRFGSGPQMVNIAPRHVLTPHPQVMVAFTGLEGDIQSLSQDLSTEVTAKLGRALGFSLISSQKQNGISPRAMASLTSHILYSRRQAPYYVEPFVVGLSASPGARPFLCSMDMIGAKSHSESFVCGGAASKSLYGTAEALWRPDMEPEELAEICGKAFQSALERDCFSGYGAVVYVMTKKGIMEYDLASRND